MSIRIKQENIVLNVPTPKKSTRKYLKKIRKKFQLKSLIDPKKSDFQNIMNLRFWIYSNLDHDLKDLPGKNKKLSKLERLAKKGNIEIDEFSVFSKTVLLALGYTVRDVRLHNAGSSKERISTHNLFEVYLRDLNKWFFIDRKFDIIIKKDGIPLNAVELQEAFLNEEELKVLNPLNKINCEDYLEFIGPFLYYFSTDLNTKHNFITRLFGSKTRLILVPQYQDFPISANAYAKSRSGVLTNSISEFYPVLNN